MLTEDEKRAFFKDGYVVVKGLIDDDELVTLRDSYANLALGRSPGFPERHVIRHEPGQNPADQPDALGERHHRLRNQVFPKGEELYRAQRDTPIEDPLAAVSKLSVPSRYDAEFDACARADKIVDIVEQLMGPNLKLYYDQVFAKPPYAPANRYHQDSVFWGFFASNSQITCQLMLDDSTEENGCIRFIPGSHEFGLVDWDHLPYMLTPDVLANETPVPLAAGDATFHHSLTLHCSGPNTTASRRRGWSIHYVSAQTRYIGTPEETEKVKKLDCLEGPEPVNGWPLIRGREFPGCV